MATSSNQYNDASLILLAISLTLKSILKFPGQRCIRSRNIQHPYLLSNCIAICCQYTFAQAVDRNRIEIMRIMQECIRYCFGCIKLIYTTYGINLSILYWRQLLIHPFTTIQDYASIYWPRQYIVDGFKCQLYIVLSNMQIKQTQRVTQSIIQTLDNKIWHQLAQRAISKMPKFKLIKQSNKILHDFVLINNHIQTNKCNINQQAENKNCKVDNLLVGGIKSIKDYIKYSKTQFSENNESNEDGLNNHISSSMPINAHEINSTDKKCTKLFLSQINQQEQYLQNLLRKTRLQNLRYNKKQQDLKTQAQFYNEKRTQSEKKKLKQSKLFTYDYEGKLLSAKVKNSTNIKFVNIRSKLNQNVNKQRHHLIQKMRSTQYSHVVDKKVVRDQMANQEELEIMQERKPITPNYNNCVNQLFKDNKSIQLGVSITDISNNSKLMAINKEQLSKNSIKLSDFKRSFKSTSMIDKKTTQKQKQKVTENKAAPTPKNTFRINTISDVQSKMIQSSLSRYSKRIDKISIKNQKIFMQSFYNDDM